jgi:major membrane immunogen (membrane-anchored lipoprotein)
VKLSIRCFVVPERMRFPVVVLSMSVLLASCSADDGNGNVVTASNYQLEQQEWARRAQVTFDEATKALDRAKLAISSIPQKENKELISILSAAQAAIQEIKQKQRDAEAQFATAKDLMAVADRENQRLVAVANDIAQRNTKLEDREQLYSYGFYASIAVIVVSIGAFVIKLPTAFLDRKFRKLELVQKQMEIDELSRKLSRES